MPALTGAEVWRDYVTDGVPASGKNPPDKADIRAWAAQIDDLSDAITTFLGIALALPGAVVDGSILWKYGATGVGVQSVGDPSATSPAGSFIQTFQGNAAGGTTALHLVPASGTLTTGTVTEIMIGATTAQAFGGNYGRWSFSNYAPALTGIVGEYGGTKTPADFNLQCAYESPASTFKVNFFWKAVSGATTAEDYQTGMVQFGGGNTANANGTVPNIIALIMPNIGSAGAKDSNAILWEGKANDGTERAVWWRERVNVSSNAGASTFKLQSNLNGAGWSDRLTVSDGGLLGITGAGIGTAALTSAFAAIAAGTTAKSQINFAAATAPTSPNNGDFWFDGTNVKIRVSGATKTFTLT